MLPLSESHACACFLTTLYTPSQVRRGCLQTLPSPGTAPAKPTRIGILADVGTFPDLSTGTALGVCLGNATSTCIT